MSDERDLRRDLAFERWWDRLIAGQNPAPDPTLDPGLEAFARRVHALGEQPPADPAFKRQLWEELMNTQPRVAVLPLPPALSAAGSSTSFGVTASCAACEARFAAAISSGNSIPIGGP